MAAHMGNAALVPLRLASAGWPVSVLYKESRMMSADFFLDGLERYGIQGIAANAGLRAYGQMLAALKQGRIVFLMLDQGVKQAKDGQVHRFLGKDMPMPAGPAQLARAARAPVLPVATLAATPRWRFALGSPCRLATRRSSRTSRRWSGQPSRSCSRTPTSGVGTSGAGGFSAGVRRRERALLGGRPQGCRRRAVTSAPCHQRPGEGLNEVVALFLQLVRVMLAPSPASLARRAIR